MAVYDPVAGLYSASMSDTGDYYHRTQIDPYMFAVIGNPKGKTVYDLACGNGYIARKLAKRGATVYASDISPKLIAIAKEHSKKLPITYAVHTATDFRRYRKEQFDTVVMNMAIHYIRNLRLLFSGIARLLKPGGTFVFSTNHPFRPSYPYSEWVGGQLNGKETLFIKVTGYLKKEQRTGVCWLDNKTKMKLYNQPLHALINGLSDAGLHTFRLEEPKGEGFAHNYAKNLRESHAIPTFVIIGARKIESHRTATPK